MPGDQTLPAQNTAALPGSPDLSGVGTLPTVSNVAAAAGKPVDSLQLNLPAMPSSAPSGFVQDIPTFSSDNQKG